MLLPLSNATNVNANPIDDDGTQWRARSPDSNEIRHAAWRHFMLHNHNCVSV